MEKIGNNIVELTTKTAGRLKEIKELLADLEGSYDNGDMSVNVFNQNKRLLTAEIKGIIDEKNELKEMLDKHMDIRNLIQEIESVENGNV